MQQNISRPANPLPRRLPPRRAVSNSSGTASTSTPAQTHTHISRSAHLNSNNDSNASNNTSSSTSSQMLAMSPAPAAGAGRSLLDLDQHNTSSLALSPRTAPRQRRSKRTVSGLNGDTTSTGSLSELTGLPLPPGTSPRTSSLSIAARNGRRIVSTPLSQAYNHVTGSGAGGLPRPNRRSGARTSLLSNSSASTSGILGGDSIIQRSSSPPSDSNTANGTMEEDEEEYASNDDEAAEELSDSSEISWTLVDRMRIWRNDALTQHLYSTAIFWGSKVFTKTRDPNDGFWLAQSYFVAGMFSRAEKVLVGTWEVRDDSEEEQAESRRKEKGKGRQRADGDADGEMNLDEDDDGGRGRDQLRSSTTERGEEGRPGLGERDSDTPTVAPSQASTIQALPHAKHRHIPGTSHPASTTSAEAAQHPMSEQKAVTLIRLTDISVACRYLAAQSMVRQEKWGQAMDMLGEVNPFKALRGKGRARADRESGDGGIKFEASMCHLRGVVQLHLNASERAKECFLEALSLDVKCYDSFEALINGSMMDVNEEWHFIQGLAFREHTPEDAEFIRMMYTIRLKKYAHRDEMERCGKALVEEYGLADDPDVLFGLADELYEAMRYAHCHAVTAKILKTHDSHAATLPLHLACMQHLPHLRSKLFLLAHELVDREPESVISWYAVGLWYFCTMKWEESRRYFGKGLLIDNRFGPAWIAFAHSFALEGEHDQAITAYSTAQRHFQGTHLPIMFIGMQYLLLSNIKAADEYLDAAYSMCQTDPLLLNERGVAAFYNESYQDSINLFSLALHHAESVQSSPSSWATTHLNMGQAHRKLRNQEEAIRCFKRTLELEPRNSQAYAALGVSYLYAARREEAIMAFHEALSLHPGEPTTTTLLKLALQDSLDHEMNPSDSVSMKFPLLSDVAAEEMDERILDEERTYYGRCLRNSITEPVDGAFDNVGGGGDPSSTGFSSSSPYTTRSKAGGPGSSSVRGKNGKNSRRRLTAEFDMPVERPREQLEPQNQDGGQQGSTANPHGWAARHGYSQRGDDNEQEENENEDSTEDMIEASIGSDMVD